MVLLSKFQNQNKTTAGELDKLVGDGHLRPYLGCSQIGHHCDRYLWFSFRWCFKQEISARLKRLFWRGHREEPEIVKELAQIGVYCYADQQEITMVHGHMKGHTDGSCIGVIEAPKTEHLAEYKTASNSKFNEMKKQGVQKANPTYYAQLQIYMRKLKLTRALFIMVNKNNDEYYVKRVRLDKGFADDLERKGFSIIMRENPPAIPQYCSKSFFKCKWCDAFNVCYGLEPFLPTCRTCVHIEIQDHGMWSCGFHGIDLATDQQRLGCPARVQEVVI